MPAPALSERETLARIEVVHQCLREGYRPPGIGDPWSKGSATEEAARRIPGIRSSSWFAAAAIRDRIDWSLYQPPSPPPVEKPRIRITAAMQRGEEPLPNADTEADTSPISAARKADATTRLKREHRDMARQLAAEEDVRAAVLGLARIDYTSPSWEVVPRAESGDLVPVLLTTDQHVGEAVDIEEMDGLNEYNVDIFRDRQRRMIERAIAVLEARNDHYPCFVYLFGGDSISGDIHEELSQTNDLTAHASVQAIVVETIRSLEILIERFGLVHFVAVPGNHGRTTRKPHAKRYADLNYDTLAAWMVEQHFRSKNETRVTFKYPRSGDALFRIYGRLNLLTHGDRIGSRGGTGHIGPAATILRGAQKVFQQYAGHGQQIDTIWHGHFHYRMWVDGVVSNSALIGFNEYARSVIRARFQPPSQTLGLVHHRWGVIDAVPLFLDDTPQVESGRPFEEAA